MEKKKLNAMMCAYTGIEQQYACRFGPGNASGVQRSTVRTCARTELRTLKKNSGDN